MNLVSWAILVFITLKVTSLVSWSWWWLFAPIFSYFFVIGLILLVSRIEEEFHG